MDIADLQSFVRKNSLFAILGDEEVLKLTAKAQLKSYRAGEVVFNQGDAGESFYIVYSGKVRIVLKDAQGREVNLGVRTGGEHFGETALITEKPRNASARAAEDSALIAISRKDFNEILFAQPGLREYFDRFMRATSVHQFLQSCTELGAVPPKDLRKLVESFQPELFREGDVVVRQGASGDKFYLVESGKLKVVKWEGKNQELVNFLREGDFFGEMALLDDSSRHADVVCLTECHLFSLSKSDFKQLVEFSPKFRKVLEDRLHSYGRKPPIPYQEVIRQQLAAQRVAAPESVQAGPPAAKGPRQGWLKAAWGSVFKTQIRFPFIRQHDEMSCGTTCLMMIARYYGYRYSSSRLRELAHVDRSGASLAGLAEAAEQLGFSCRGVKLDYDALRSLKLPCVVHWQGYHYIVVHRVSDRRVWVADPAFGLRTFTRQEFLRNWNGIALSLDPTPSLGNQPSDHAPIRNFLRFVWPHRGVLTEILLASLLLNLFGLATPIFTQNIIDKVLVHENVSMLNLMLAGMLLVLVFRFVIGIVRQYLIVHTSTRVDLDMLVAFYRHLLALPLRFFKVRKIGDFITRFGENRKIRNFLTNTLLTLVLDTVLVLVYITLMFCYNIPLAGLAMVFIPIYVLLTLAFTPLLKRLNVESFAARAESDSLLVESIHGIDTVKAMNTESHARWKWEEKFIRSLNIDFKLYNTAVYFHALGDFVGALSSTLVLWFGAHQVLQHSMTMGELMAFMVLLGSVMGPLNRIIVAWDEIQQTLVAVDRLQDVFGASTEFPMDSEKDTGLVLKEPAGEVVFENVYFRYGGTDDPYILTNISFRIAPGERVAIVGRSGSGKSTLARLIPRFYEATEGRVRIDGYDVRSLNLQSLRQKVGVVLQESFLFNGTIRENIASGDVNVTMDKVVAAAKAAHAHDFISSLAHGYETHVGEGGLQLSGGQRQRITIARVLYREPPILILDEATSSLDSESEQAIRKSMAAAFKGRTAVVIAHRLSTVRDADRILVVDGGEIVEQGTHEELLDRRGLYHYLCHQQMAS